MSRVGNSNRGHDLENASALAELAQLIAGLDAAQLEQALDADWTIGAVLGHLTFWDGYVAFQALPEWLVNAVKRSERLGFFIDRAGHRREHLAQIRAGLPQTTVPRL